MLNKTIKCISVSVHADKELTDEHMPDEASVEIIGYLPIPE